MPVVVQLALVVRAGTLLAAGLALGLGVDAIRGDGLALQRFAAPVVCDSDAALGSVADAGGVEVLAAEEAGALCGASGSALILDARSAEAFAQGHAAGALHLPCSASDGAARVAARGVGPGGLVLVYAEDTEAALPVARQMRQRLGSAGQRIAVLAGGFAAWREAHLACSSGGCPECEGEPEP